MKYLLIEDFRDGDPGPVYQRLRSEGRGLPQGLVRVASWVTADLERCYQVMECEDRAILERWIASWSELVEFEVVPVVTSEEAASLVASRATREPAATPARDRSGHRRGRIR